ncbi:MAG: hypothetical protein QOF28_632, partial [Actinomycetota bacterium]|nr:hypothetical protein [Actinomycetota bacterium]
MRFAVVSGTAPLLRLLLHSRFSTRSADKSGVGNSPGGPPRREYERLRGPGPTRVWERGASGERIVGARLDRIGGIEVLHDRQIPGTRAGIDHVAIGPGGVYVVAAKLSRGIVRHRPAGGLGRREWRVFVGDKDQTKLVAKMGTQVDAITRALRETPILVT